MATITAKELAARCDTDPRTIRKFIRSESGLNTKVGKGQRWAIDSKSVASLKKRFNAWNAARAEKATNEDEALDAPETDDEVEVLDDADAPEGDDEVNED